MTKMIKALIFDMDGLMFDTERPYLELLKVVCNEHGILISDEELHQLIGVSSHMVEQFEHKYPGITQLMDEVDERYDEYFFNKYPSKGSANKKGLKELYEYAKGNGYKLAIASSSRERHIKNLVEYSGLNMEFDAIVSSHSKIPSKPNPDVFLLAAEQLNVDIDNCLVLEDSKFGIMAAYNAKMHRVWIPDTFTNDDEIKDILEFKCNSLDEVINILKKY